MKTIGTSKPVVRCAVYTRKSTDEGLDKEFTSLDAQRESAEAFIQSQKAQGWTCQKTRYDDGGFTGGNMERPALKRLLADIASGQVNCVVVYKVDRLSRSLLDFARMMETFEQHRVSFVSVTQQFNTATSMGRLVLNVLLSFAQFEREIISERTRDKIAAARRKGKWTGGMPLLGYDVDPRSSKLVVNEPEALQVRAIFGLYLKQRGLIPVVLELQRRGWKTKRWQTRKGRERGGLAFTKTSLHHLLTNVVYLGKVKHKKESFPGEHEAIVPTSLWKHVQRLLHKHGRVQNRTVRQPSGALLQGLLYCRSCGFAMTPSHSTKRGGRRYGYYACLEALKKGRQRCPSGWVPASEIEQLVVSQLREFVHKNPPPPAGTNGFDSLGLLADPDKWAALPADEQARAIHETIQRVDYDGQKGRLSITLCHEASGKVTSACHNHEHPKHDRADHD
jgi:site-specific DNA recombinase